MSLTVKFYNNSSKINQADKNLTEHERYEGNGFRLKESSSVTDPVLLCKLSNNYPEINNNTNYMYIQDFDRYYFITDIRIVPGGLVEISAHCDVLTTAWKRKDDNDKSRLGKCKGIVHRSEAKHNLYIDDGFFRVKNKPKIQTHSFSNSFNDYSFVMMIAGT